jgi:hypothetical protein
VTGIFFRVFAAIAWSEKEMYPQVASAAALANPINRSRGIRFAKIEDEQIIIFGLARLAALEKGDWRRIQQSAKASVRCQDMSFELRQSWLVKS